MFLAPNFERFTKYDAFCLQSFNYACLRSLRDIVTKRFENAENFYSFKALLKMAGGGVHPTLPGSAPVSEMIPRLRYSNQKVFFALQDWNCYYLNFKV